MKFKGWILYDGDCRYCTELASRFHHILKRHDFKLAPLQEPWVRARLGLPEHELLAEMRLLQSNGRIMGGADALFEISRHFWWAWPAWQIVRIPSVMGLFRAGYRWIARNRHCVGGTCQLDMERGRLTPESPKTRDRLTDFLPLVCLPLFALCIRPQLPPWVFMWAMAFALFAGCKCLTCRLAARTLGHPNLLLTCGYLLVWPGMNAPEFFDRRADLLKPKTVEWLLAVSKTIFGGILLWGITRLALPLHPLLAGWTGMIGVIFLLHFGLFHLLSLAWRELGVKAEPLMKNPLRADSLSDFWGARWNTAFNELAFRLAFRPLRRKTSRVVATLAVFGISGLIHDLIISLPARGGYGLPTAYFLIQGIGVIFERSRLGQAIGLGHGIRGWAFTAFVAAGPVFWLFHPPFIHNVILPMLTAIGAT